MLMDYIVWWEENQEGGLEEIHSKFLSVFTKAEFIPTIYNPILNKYYGENNLKHWDLEVMNIGNKKIADLHDLLGDAKLKNTLLRNMNLFVDSLVGIQNISRRIELMDNFKGSMELKASLFLISIYNDLLNGPYSKILQLYIKFQGEIEGKNLDQKTLTPQMQCLSTRDYDEILDLADSNIRNAMSHDGVKIENNKIYFTYRKGKDTLKEEYSIYEVKDKVITLFDSINGLIISFIRYLIGRIITFDDIYNNEKISNEIIAFYEKLSMSTLNIECKSIEELELHKDKTTQINVTLKHNNLDISSRYVFGIHTAARVYALRNLTPMDKVLITFEADKTLTSFIRIPGETIQDYLNGNIDEASVVEVIQKNRDQMLFPSNEEPRNKYEDLFRYYPDIEHENFIIKEIEDVSHIDQKRFKAVVYVKKTLNRKHVEKLISEAINEMIKLKNYGFTDHRVKHGEMEADVLYLVVYKKEIRGTKHRTLMPSNKNFLVQVQFDKDKEFNVKNPLIDRNLYKVIKNKVEFNWNPNFYKFS